MSFTRNFRTHSHPSDSIVIVVLLGLCCLACCPAWQPSADRVNIADQEVLIWWDSANGIEHFVRRANFDAETVPDDFGFLVPTPSQPKLSETPDQLFSRLSHAIKPEVLYEDRYRPTFMPFLAIPFSHFLRTDELEAMPAEKSVEVLETTFVGGFEASVLRATEVDALIAWLEENGYAARPELREWLEPYIEKQWIVTAFKYDCEPGANERSLARAAVCMSFATDAPFFPYRVPTDQIVSPEEGSLLRLYFAGDKRMDGQFEHGNKPWPAHTKFSAEVADPSSFLGQVNTAEYPSDPQKLIWLTAFEDNTWPGGTEDLYFTSSNDSGEVRPPPIVREFTSWIWLPPDLILGIGTVGFILVRRRRKNQDSNP